MRAVKVNIRDAKEARVSVASIAGAKRRPEARPAPARNAVEETIDLYGVRNWGSEYFDVNREGELVLAFEGTRGTPIVLKDLVTEVQHRGLSTPIVLRFPQMLDYQIKKLA